MLVKKIPLYYVILAVFLGAAITLAIFEESVKVTSASASSRSSVGTAILSQEQTGANCKTSSVRLAGYSYIHPLLYSEKDCESENLDYIKQDIVNYIASEKAKGTLITASVYLRVFSKGEWTTVNADEKYHPASLNKIPILITYLHMAESYNALLDQKIFFNKHDTALPVQNYTFKTLASGHYYTIKELLDAMIRYSDNDATLLLLQRVNMEYYNKTFTDLGLEKPSFEFDKFFLSAKQYSLFFRVLYNATYLAGPVSEYAMSFLAKCEFREGLLKKLPPDVKAAHKFGESGYDSISELHESGIIYAGKNTYLITIMTKGKDWKDLSEIIGNISNLVYNKLATNT